MKRAKVVRDVEAGTGEGTPMLRALPGLGRRLPALATAQIHDVAGATVVLELSGELVPAMLDASAHPTVIVGAHERRGCVLVEHSEDGSIVVLRRAAYAAHIWYRRCRQCRIEARRISIEVGEELSLKAQTAAVVLRALGEVETYAECILSRAEGGAQDRRKDAAAELKTTPVADSPRGDSRSQLPGLPRSLPITRPVY